MPATGMASGRMKWIEGSTPVMCACSVFPPPQADVGRGQGHGQLPERAIIAERREDADAGLGSAGKLGGELVLGGVEEGEPLDQHVHGHPLAELRAELPRLAVERPGVVERLLRVRPEQHEARRRTCRPARACGGPGLHRGPRRRRGRAEGGDQGDVTRFEPGPPSRAGPAPADGQDERAEGREGAGQSEGQGTLLGRADQRAARTTRNPLPATRASTRSPRPARRPARRARR